MKFRVSVNEPMKLSLTGRVGTRIITLINDQRGWYTAAEQDTTERTLVSLPSQIGVVEGGIPTSVRLGHSLQQVIYVFDDIVRALAEAHITQLPDGTPVSALHHAAPVFDIGTDNVSVEQTPPDHSDGHASSLILQAHVATAFNATTEPASATPALHDVPAPYIPGHTYGLPPYTHG